MATHPKTSMPRSNKTAANIARSNKAVSRTPGSKTAEHSTTNPGSKHAGAGGPTPARSMPGQARTTVRQSRAGATAVRTAGPNKTATRNSAASGTKRGAGARTSAGRRLAGAEGAPASRAEDATNGRQGRTGKTRGAAKEAAPSLVPLRKKQNRNQIIATVATESGASITTVESVARSLSRTLTRHLIRGGSGRVEIPYLGAVLWRGRRAAQKARIMNSPVLGREVKVPSQPAQPAPRLRAHRALRDVVAARRI